MITSVFIEVRPRLQACNVCVTLKEGVSEEITLSLKRKSLVIRIAKDSYLITFEKFEIEPLTMTALRTENSCVSFRIQVDCKYFPEAVKHEPPSIPVPENEFFKITCRCGNPVTENVSFDRVLPLPSGMFDASDMYCHVHGNQPSKSISPRPKDCLYADHFISLHNAIVRTKNKEKFVRCERCLNAIGVRSDDCVLLWKSNILLPNGNLTATQEFLRIINNAVKESFSIFIKVLLECQENERYLLVLVVDKQLLLFRAGSDLNLKMEQVIKVRYAFHGNSDDEVETWLADACVQHFKVSRTLFNASFEFLTNSSQNIPSLFNIADGEFMAYLESTES